MNTTQAPAPLSLTLGLPFLAWGLGCSSAEFDALTQAMEDYLSEHEPAEVSIRVRRCGPGVNEGLHHYTSSGSGVDLRNSSEGLRDYGVNLDRYALNRLLNDAADAALRAIPSGSVG